MIFRQKQSRGAAVLQPGQLVAYFCAEFGITDALPIYSGGLGVLAGDIVQEAAERSLPFIGVGLFYKKGYFEQQVTITGQHESPQTIDPRAVPLELLTDTAGETLLVEVPIHERIVYAQVWKYMVGSVPLYLLDTDHWKNNAADRTITDQLYGGDHAKRIQQELVLGIGGYRALEKIGARPTLYHMNEGHSAFLALELTQRIMNTEKIPVSEAHSKARQRLVFTNHTLVAAGNDAFPHEQIRFFLGKYAFDSGIGITEALNWGNSPDQPGTFSMTMLALRSACRSNAVSRLHAEKAMSLWPEHHLLAITNGVHLPAWIAPAYQKLLTAYAPEWRRGASDPQAWKGVRRIPYTELWQTHRQLKIAMLEAVRERTRVELNPDILTVVWARRFATYKRPGLLFADIERLKKLLFHATQPIQVIVSGKSHPADAQGKEIIRHIEELSTHELRHRAVFVDDYSITLAKHLVAGADVWLNTPIYGLEASGTSGMKASANGVIQFTTPDGWAHEVDWYGMGYTLPLDQAETEIYTLFERKIIPTYYRRTTEGIPELWIAMMKETMASVAPQFSSQRMLNDYIQTLYTLTEAP